MKNSGNICEVCAGLGMNACSACGGKGFIDDPNSVPASGAPAPDEHAKHAEESTKLGEQATKLASDDELPYIDVIFDGPPSEPGRFVEVETPGGRSIRVGEWVEQSEGMWALRIPSDFAHRLANKLAPDDVIEEAEHCGSCGEIHDWRKVCEADREWMERVARDARALKNGEEIDGALLPEDFLHLHGIALRPLAALRAEREAKDSLVVAFYAERARLRSRLEEVEAERDKLREVYGRILRGVAEAIDNPSSGEGSSWHDLGEKVASRLEEVEGERDRYREALELAAKRASWMTTNTSRPSGELKTLCRDLLGALAGRENPTEGGDE